MYGADRPWLWRGQRKATHALSPAVHTRIATDPAKPALNDGSVLQRTESLLKAARLANLDRHEGANLPDLALLARLQHHGAATPLLDVSLDPMVALYMAVVSPASEHESEDESEDESGDGVLFAISKPRPFLRDFDSRSIADVYTLVAKVGVHFYSAPDVSERLRIQRGHFLIGSVQDDSDVTIPLSVDKTVPLKDGWIWKRLEARGRKGPVPPASSDIVSFRIAQSFKDPLRKWLEARTGLTPDFVYPTSWHQPHLDRFADAHGRTAGF